MDFNELIDEVTELSENYIATMGKVPANQLGLDPRCGKLFVSPDCIAVYKENDRGLQYYGGFEYVNEAYRNPIGDYVFYSALDGRVQDALEHYLNIMDEV